MCRSVSDAAVVLSVIAGPDPNDNYTLAQPLPVPDFAKALDKNALKGARIGIPRKVFMNESISGNDPFVSLVFELAIQTIRELGATIIDPADIPSIEEIQCSESETIVTNTDFKVDLLLYICNMSLITIVSKIQINDWFSNLKANPSGVRNLADLIAFNDENPTLEEPANFTDQTRYDICR